MPLTTQKWHWQTRDDLFGRENQQFGKRMQVDILVGLKSCCWKGRHLSGEPRFSTLINASKQLDISDNYTGSQTSMFFLYFSQPRSRHELLPPDSSWIGVNQDNKLEMD